MKVAQLLYSGLGGHGSVAFSLISGDEARAWSNALCFIGTEPLLPAYRAKCQELAIDCLYVPTNAGRPWKSWAKVFAWLRQQRPDALLVHSSTVLLPCLAYGAANNVPVIAVEHTPIALKRRRDWLLSAAAMFFADRVVVLSDAYMTAMSERLGRFFRRSKTTVVLNGVDISIFAPAPICREGPEFRIGMAARFAKAKRQRLLVDVIRELARATRGVTWRLTFAGAGKEFAAVQQYAASRGVECISFEGALDELRLADWYRSLRIYLHASDGEALSTSILQAMASGLPIVASDVPGIRDQVTAEFGVLLPNDPERWVATIREIAENPQLAELMGERARLRCEEFYSDQMMYVAYDRLVGDVLASRARTSS